MQNLYEPDPEAREPLVSVGVITAAASTVLAVVAAFGLDITGDQQTAILAVVAVAAPLIVAWWGRRKVYSPATVAKLLRR